MSTLTVVAGLFSVKPSTTGSEDGRMALADHFRELRARLMRAVLCVVIATLASFFFYDQLLALVVGPFNDAVDALGGAEEARSAIVVSGIAGGLMLQLKLCALAGIVVSSPYWLYQIWGFLLPGLRSDERRWSMLFVAVAGPLFLAGVAVGYYSMPKGMQVLISFNPDGMTNLNDFDGYLSFTTRIMLVFGVSFEIPFFVVILNLAGVLSGATLAANRPWIVLGTLAFAAIATPSTDPFSMLLLAVPMCLLFLLSEVIARAVDRRRRGAARALWSDDEASPL